VASAQKFLVHIDLGGQELRNAVLGTSAGTAPGAIWFDPTTHTVNYVEASGTVRSIAPVSYVDAAISNAQAALSAAVTTIEGLIGAEAAARIAGDEALAADLAQVAAAAAAGLSAESSARTAAVSSLEAQLSQTIGTLATDSGLSSAAEAAAREAADAQLASDLADESARAQVVESGLQTQLDELDNNFATDESVGAVATVLNAETDLRLSGDAALAAAIADESTARQAADAQLGTEISTASDAAATAVDAETTRAMGAEAAIASDLADEVTARVSAVTAVENALSAEAAARATGDASNATNLSSEVSRAEAAEAALTASLGSETTARTAADSALSARVSTVETTLPTLATTASLTSAISAEAAARTTAIATARTQAQAYADSILQGLDYKASVKGATTSALVGASVASGVVYTKVLSGSQLVLGIFDSSQRERGNTYPALENANGLSSAQLTTLKDGLNAVLEAEQNRRMGDGPNLLPQRVTGIEFVDANSGGGQYGTLKISMTAAIATGYTLFSVTYSPNISQTTITSMAAIQGQSSAALSGTKTIDGISLAAGDRVLVKDQTTASENGIYVVGTGDWARATDADGTDLTPGAFTFVEGGTVNGSNGFVLLASGSWTQFSGAGQIVAGDGLEKTANELKVKTGNGLKITGDQVQLDGPVTVANGGTGASTEAGARTNLNVPSRYAASIGDGTANTFTINHGLGTKDVVVSVRGNDDDEFVLTSVKASSTSTVTIEVGGTPPATNAYRVVVIG
jgi:hypothetical protein